MSRPANLQNRKERKRYAFSFLVPIIFLYGGHLAVVMSFARGPGGALEVISATSLFQYLNFVLLVVMFGLLVWDRSLSRLVSLRSVSILFSIGMIAGNGLFASNFLSLFNMVFWVAFLFAVVARIESWDKTTSAGIGSSKPIL